MKRSWSRIFALTLGIPLLLAILVACGGTGTTGGSGTSGGGTTSGGIIKIATDLPVSGAEATDGKPAENGAHLAVDQANANHTIPGYTLVFDPQDDVGASGVHDPAVGAANVTKLIGDAEVAGIIGPFNSSVAQSEMPIANEAPIVLISPSNTNTCLTQNSPDTGCTGANDMLSTLRPTGKVTYFRIATTDNHQGAVGADFLYKTQGYKTAYVIDGTKTGGPVFSTVAAVDVTKVPSAASFIQQYQAKYGPLGAYSASGYDCAQILILAIKAAIASGAKPPTD